jgi:CRISPR-associated protein Cst2
LKVRFKEYPQPDKFVDDFFFGYLLAVKDADRKKVEKTMGKNYPIKRDSVLRTNLAKAIEPYRHDAVFTQSPLNVDSPWRNAEQSALLHRETAVTAFQYPFAINLGDCSLDDKGKPADGIKAPEGKPYKTHGEQHKDWLCYLLKAISELNGVAGNHARSYFEMAPASIVIRVTDSLVAGYETYGFQSDGRFPEVVDGILHDDYRGEEFYLGGQIVKMVLDDHVQEQLKAKGVNLFRMANKALDAVAKRVCGRGFLKEQKEGKGGV